jgi:hypothetical protein
MKRICTFCQRKYVPLPEWRARLCGVCRRDIPQVRAATEEVRHIALDKLKKTLDKTIIIDLLKHLQRCNKEERACHDAQHEPRGSRSTDTASY